MTAAEKLLAKVTKMLLNRPDVHLLSSVEHDAFGLVKRTYSVNRSWEKNPWQPLTVTKAESVAHAFALDIWPSNDKPSAKQLAVIDSAKRFGVLHAWIKSEDDVIDLLGPPPPNETGRK